MKKFLALVGACTTIFTSAFINNKVDAIIPNQTENVVFLGDYDVGKYDIIKNIYDRQHNTDLIVYVDRYEADVTDSLGNAHTINMIDTPGQEQFRSLIPSYLRHSRVAVIVCNYDDLDSLNHVDDWVNLVRGCNPLCSIIIVANNAGTSNPQFTANSVNNKGIFLMANAVNDGVDTNMHFINGLDLDIANQL